MTLLTSLQLTEPAFTHVVVSDSRTGFVHGIWPLATLDDWSNIDTYQADQKVTLASAGDVVYRLGPNIIATRVADPAFDETDFEGFGVFEVDSKTNPTNVRERPDAVREEPAESDPGGKYTYTT